MILGDIQNPRVARSGAFTQATNATGRLIIDTKPALSASGQVAANYLQAIVNHNAATATNSSAKFTILAIQESSDGTNNWTDISGFVGTTNSTATSSQFVLPAHNDTSNAQSILFGLDLRGHQRYIGVYLQPSASYNTLNATVMLYRVDQSPDTNTERNVGAAVIG